MAFKQIRALLVRYSPRSVKCKRIEIVPQTAPAATSRPRASQRSTSLEEASIADCTDDDASWDDVPPKLQLDAFSKHDQGRPVTPTRRDAIIENVRLREMVQELNGRAESLEQNLSRKHTTLAELEAELEQLWDTANEQQKRRAQLEDEIAMLIAQVELLSTSKWRPLRQLRARLLEVDSRAKLAECQVVRMKAILADAVKERREVREEAYELWDAILKTGVQQGALGRADHAMHRLSIRFDFEDGRSQTAAGPHT